MIIERQKAQYKLINYYYYYHHHHHLLKFFLKINLYLKLHNKLLAGIKWLKDIIITTTILLSLLIFIMTIIIIHRF